MATKTTSPILHDVQKNSFPVSYNTLHTTDLVYSFYPSCCVGSSIRIPAFQDMYTYWQKFLRARCPQNDPTLCICHSCYMDITDFIESYYFIYAQTTKMCQHQDCECLHNDMYPPSDPTAMWIIMALPPGSNNLSSERCAASWMYIYLPYYLHQ